MTKVDLTRPSKHVADKSLPAPNVVLEEIRKAVEAKGADHVVHSCSIYEEDRTGREHKSPSCLVGQVIYQLVGDEEFQKVHSGTVEGPLMSVGYDVGNMNRLGDNGEWLPREVLPLSYRILEDAQDWQDGGWTDDDSVQWGDKSEPSAEWLAANPNGHGAQPWGAVYERLVHVYGEAAVESSLNG